MAGIDSFTKLMLHCNGTDTSTTFTDDSLVPHTVTALGNAQIDTSQSKFGGASGLFDGSGDRLSVPDSDDWFFGSDDFTMDFWVRFPVNQSACFIAQGTSGSNRSQFNYSASSGNLSAYCIDNGTAQWNISTPGSSFIAVINTWYHIALVRDGNTLRFFVGGTQIGSGSVTGDVFPNYGAVLFIGQQFNGSNQINGWMDEIRISKGIARWTANFTPPTSEYTGVTFEVNADLQADYDIFQAVNQDLELDYHIGIGTVNNDLESIYHILSTVNQDSQLKYDLGIGIVNNDIESIYHILSAVNQDLELDYHIGIGAVNQDLLLKYGIFNLLLKDLEAIYSINDPVIIDQNFKYDIGIGAVNQDLECPYDNIGAIFQVSRDLQAKYRIGIGAVNQDLECPYDNIGAIFQVSRDLQAKYRIGIGAVNQDLECLWDFAFLSVDSQFKYDLLLRSSNPTKMQHNFSNTVLKLHFNESSYDGSPNEVQDSSGFQNHGSTTGIPSITTGKFHNAVQLTNSSSVSIAHSNQLNLSSAFTILFWINPQEYNLSVLSKGTNYDISVLSNGKLQFGNASMGRITGNLQLNLNQWNFVVCLFTYNALKTYINGEIDNSLLVSKNLPLNSSNLVFGNNGTFLLDEVHILNQRLDYHKQIDRYLKIPSMTNLIRSAS